MTSITKRFEKKIQIKIFYIKEYIMNALLNEKSLYYKVLQNKK